jgi:hypothetical protein
MRSFFSEHPVWSALLAFAGTFLGIIFAGFLFGIWIESTAACSGPCNRPVMLATSLWKIIVPAAFVLGGIAGIIVGMLGSIKKP